MLLELRSDEDVVSVDEKDKIEQDADDNKAFKHAHHGTQQLVEKFGFDHFEKALDYFA